MIFANLLLGTNQGLAWSATMVMKIDLVGEKNRGLAMGINEFAGLNGKRFGDKGYMTALFEEFYQQGLQLITKVRLNMKNKLKLLEDKLKLRKRAVVESVNDILTSVFDLEHTRHRSAVNAMAHMLAALTAYCFYDGI